MRLSARGTAKYHESPYVVVGPNVMSWLRSPGGTRHRTLKSVYEGKEKIVENKVPVVSSAPFRPVVICGECHAKCTADLQRAGRIALAQREYDAAAEALRIAENNLRTAVQHD